MRRSALAILALTATAMAEPRLPTVIRVPARTGPAEALSSNIIYLHKCEDAGCPILAGANDDSRTHTSQIADGNRTIGAFTQSEQVWEAMVQCVKDTYRAFDVTVTDVDPGNVPHFEEIIGGKPTDLRGDIANAGGVAPFNCSEVPNGISFTFDVYGADPDSLCWTVSQETAHTFGLEHEFLQKDPMTYAQGDLPKRFQWEDAPCGTNTAMACQCSTTGKQNSYKKIYDAFGVGQPTPPALEISSPTDGKKVTPRFPILTRPTDDAAIDHLELWVDGAMVSSVTAAPWQFVAPELSEGSHAIEVHAIDVTQMSTTVAITVDQGPPCTAAAGCTGHDVCVMGGCLAGPDEPGGLGVQCSSDTDCISLTCVDGGDQFEHCGAACDPGIASSCPDSFACLASGTGGYCYPSDEGGCCAIGGDARGPIVLGLLFAALLWRRKR